MILRSFESAAKGMYALTESLDNTAHNLSNVNTVGYKRSALTFKNIYDANVVQRDGELIRGESSARNLGELSMGSEVQKLTYDFSQGAHMRTDNPLDVSIEGDGFFKIQSVDGEITYTRKGNFTINNNDFLTTKDGDLVLDVRDRPIRILTDGLKLHSKNDIIISENGTIEINNENNKLMQQTIAIYDFRDKEALFCVGDSKFITRDPVNNPPIFAEKFGLQQKMLEMSNSNVIREMLNMINTSRNYESLAKLVKTNGEMLNSAIGVGRINLL